MSDSRRRFSVLPQSLSAKLLLLTIAVIMATEVFIFIPSVANFRLTWLARHFNTGEAVSLALERIDPASLPVDMPKQLLDLTQTEMIVVQREGARRVLATQQMPNQIDVSVEMMPPGRAAAVASITEALNTLLFGGDRTMRVYGEMEKRPGRLELIMKDKPLRDDMLTYAGNVMLISLAISLFTGLVVFLVLRWFLISPLQRMTGSMLAFAADPEDSANVIEPTGRDDEIGVAEEQLGAMQKQLRGTFTQQRHLADLGLAVSKINHDMRNILASASLFTDRLSAIEDPLAKRLAPRLVRSVDRAADYTRSVLEYGKAGEALPQKNVLRLHRLCEEVAETLALDKDTEVNGGQESRVDWVNAVPEDMEIEADPEQLFRVIVNLARNAVQAMEGGDHSVVRRLKVEARHANGECLIAIHDTGPGIPEQFRETLFSAFQTTDRKGGTGLGLTIAAEIVRAHGGSIRLVETDKPGSCFEIRLSQSGQKGGH